MRGPRSALTHPRNLYRRDVTGTFDVTQSEWKVEGKKLLQTHQDAALNRNYRSDFMTSTSVGARVCGAIALGASLCLAGPAFAQQTSALKIEAASGKGSLQGVGGSVFTNADTTANAALTVLPLLSFDVSGTPSIDGSNSPNNVYIVLDATPFSTM